MSAFAIGAQVRLRDGVTPNHASDRVRRHETYVVIGETWNEPGEYVGDGTENKHPDWACVPLVNYHQTAIAMDYARRYSIPGIRAFVKYYGDEAEIAFADVADIEVIPVEGARMSAQDDRFVKQVVKVENGVATVVSVEPHGSPRIPDAWRRKAIAAEHALTSDDAK